MSLSTLTQSTMFQSLFTPHPSLKNIALSGAYLYGSRLLVKSMDTPQASRYSLVSNSVLPFGAIYCLYMSRQHLKMVAEFPMQGFLKYVLKMYSNLYTGKVLWSCVVFAVGYPSVNILYYMMRNYLQSDQILSAYRTLLDSFGNIVDTLIPALQENKNWDLTYHGVSLTTWSVPKPFINQDELEKAAPLRMRSTDNVSEFKYDHTCNICTEEIDSNKMHRELPCQHVFHPECVDKWLLERDSNCPMCREPVLATATEEA